jgi:hypothetical protein
VKRLLLLIAFALGITAMAAAADFGLIMDLEPEYASSADGEIFTFTRNYIPWFSASLNEKTTVYTSAKFALEDKYRHVDEWWKKDFFFEPERVEINIRPQETVYLTFGRQRYRDTAGMIAAGNLDGFHGTFGLGRARITGGAFFTGFLYKKTAEILMTAMDRENYEDSGMYFASRRILMTLGAEFPDLTSQTSLALSTLAQFDMNGYGGSGLHSQYLEARYGIEAVNTLHLAFTLVGGLTETGWDPRINFAAALAADWEVPGALADMLSAELCWGSGAVNKGVGPFLPITGITRGQVFTPTLSGLMNGRLSYIARLHSVLSFSSAAAVFLRTDVETLVDPELDNATKNRFLGGEFYGQFIWAPQSPLRITVGGGVFLPGGAFIKDADPRWKLNTGLIFSL